ncbi:hypothetical protein MMC25_006879 [Agyrium rufum]|nr:hypothetical protein [Agyrium rufum]
MPSRSTIVTTASSTALRISAFIFLRWIPGHHFPPIVTASLITYLFSFSLAAEANKEDDEDGGSPEEETVEGVVTRSAARNGDVKEIGALDKIADGIKAASKKTAGVSLDTRISEAVAMDESAAIFKTLWLGIPHATSHAWNAMALAINISIAFMVTDFIYRGPYLYPSNDLAFSKVGYVSDTSAKILVREPDTAQLPIYISYRELCKVTGLPDPNTPPYPWKRYPEPIYWLTNETDYTSAITLSQLSSSTEYEYIVSSLTSPPIKFTTAPSASSSASSHITFLSSSCLKPHFPYSPFSHPLSIPGLSLLRTHVLPQLSTLSVPKPSFMLFLGDFIYIDVPRRLGFDVSTYRSEYRRVYASPDWTALDPLSLPWLHVLDDHEIANDWDANTTAPYPAALDPWTHYQHSTNPPPARVGKTYFTFTHGPASFFMMDTRRFRTPEFSPTDAFSTDKSMLGEEQLSDLLKWLSAPANSPSVRWKFVVSSIPFTRNWRFGTQDTWGGYLAERSVILRAMWDAMSHPHRPVGVVVLSGDRHEFAATAFPPPISGTDAGKWDASQATVYEFSTSPLSMFYLPVRTYREDSASEANEMDQGNWGRDVCIKYLPDGNSKVAAVEVENVGEGRSVLKFRLFVEGKEEWSTILLSPEPGKGRSGRGAEGIWS